MSDTANPGTLTHAALAFLRRQADGEITSTNLARGIGRSAKHLRDNLDSAIREGLLSHRVSDGCSWWSLGPNADTEQHPVSPEDLTHQRVIQVSAAAVSSVFAYAAQRSAPPFSVSLSTDGRMSIERHGRVLAELTNNERDLLVKSATQGVAPA